MSAIGPGLAFVPICLLGFVATLTDPPNAVTEVLVQRIKIDLWPFSQVSLGGVVVTSSASANSPRMYLQYSYDESAWSTLMTATLPLNGAGVAKRTVWEDIPMAAKTDVYIRLVTNGGDAAADPVITNVFMNLR